MSKDAEKIVFCPQPFASYAACVNGEVVPTDWHSRFEDALESANTLKRLYPERRVEIVKGLGSIIDIEKERTHGK